MALHFGLIKFLLILALVDRALQAPSPEHRQDRDSPAKLVEFKLPVKITSMHDLVAWARNAMRSMASRIDITLESVNDEAVETTTTASKREDPRSSSGKDTRARSNKEPPSSTREQQQQQQRPTHARHESRRPVAPPSLREQQQQRPAHARQESRRPVAPNALISTYASLLEPSGDSLDAILGAEGDVARDVEPYGNLNAYLPLFLDDAEIARYREEALRKYYLENEQAKRRQSKKEGREKNAADYSQTDARVDDNDNDNDNSNDVNDSKNSSNNNKNKNEKTTKNGGQKETKKLTPVISVPFEAIVTITRENVAEPTTRTSPTETREPPDEFPPYFERDYPRREAPTKIEPTGAKGKRPKEQKRQIATLGDLLRMLGLTKKVSGDKSGKGEGTRAQSNRTRPRKPSEKFTPPPLFQFEDEQPQRQRRNETSQRQEFDDDEEEEEPTGSLGSITDLLPLVIPILEDISDPNTQTDLGEVLEAALPLVQGLSEPDENDEDAVDILAMIGPILTKIIGGKDGQGSDVAAVLGPAITLIAPLIGPILGPLVGPLLSTSSNPPQGEGSSLATLITAVLGPLTQPNEPGGMSPLSVLTAGVIAALSKELRPGLPGGLDVGAVVGSVLSGVIAGTSAGLSGSLSSDKTHYQPYGPAYGAGPVQAGSVNTGTNAGFVFPGPQANSQQLTNSANRQPVPANVGEHHRIVHHTTRRPYSTLPQRIPPGPQPQPRPPHSASYVQPQVTGPLQAGTTNNGNGDSSYLPYGTSNAVPANSVNPIGLISNLIKDILGAGIQVGSSVINAVFGIIGSSSSEEPKPVYGPPAPSPYGQNPR